MRILLLGGGLPDLLIIQLARMIESQTQELEVVREIGSEEKKEILPMTSLSFTISAPISDLLVTLEKIMPQTTWSNSGAKEF